MNSLTISVDCHQRPRACGVVAGCDLHERRLRMEVERIRKSVPDLYTCGFRDYRCDAVEFVLGRGDMLALYFLRQVAKARAFLALCRASARVNRFAHSYALKHASERWHAATFPYSESYCANGAFIVAAILAGFTWRRCAYPGEINACFNIADGWPMCRKGRGS
jgi:hypothetical protein